MVSCTSLVSDSVFDSVLGLESCEDSVYENLLLIIESKFEVRINESVLAAEGNDQSEYCLLLTAIHDDCL